MRSRMRERERVRVRVREHVRSRVRACGRRPRLETEGILECGVLAAQTLVLAGQKLLRREVKQQGGKRRKSNSLCATVHVHTPWPMKGESEEIKKYEGRKVHG
eukprot:1957960-Pleurochrysis_carterae.AAC.4